MPVSKKRKKKTQGANQRKQAINQPIVRYICTSCGAEEEIPLSVVKTFDEMDQSNIIAPLIKPCGY